MTFLKFTLILLLTLGYSIWAEWLDLYHAIVAGIPFAMLVLILILLEIRRARDMEEEGEEDERGILSTVFAALILTVIVLVIANGVVWLVDNKTDFNSMFYDTDRTTLMSEIETRKEDGNWAKIEEIAAARLAKKTISKTWSRELAEIGYDAIIKQGENVSEEDWQTKLEVYQRAEMWATTYGLKPELAKAKIALVKTPTPTPTVTPTPRPTNTPTPVPTATPRPALLANKNNPCPPSDTPIKRVFKLNDEVPQGNSSDIATTAHGAFVNQKIVVVNIPEGFQQVCLASDSNGLGSPKTDDQIEAVVTYNGVPIEPSLLFNFYSLSTAGIGDLPPQDLGWIFTRPGEYLVKLTLRDTIPPVFSSTALWLIVK